ncbi:ACR3 family arsenite efflux transporter [Candidatus Cetobacterium colombiensis]|uniref:ACR3 family arsenite efflux transporter n=1 Tax=Candidatus Cetobacterium colombiensis TaxID=3073100 RepID=A0ABU4WC52_9FUSO|nr:ACR3 family arsenite efflux transporter [Candidatus Cetobacterium colombiensis]MDX8337121.1 ACR3 family arsenite efflux transporter [Candidatus Cetobacterium colombiensis]
MGFFEKYLSIWVGICIILGVGIGIFVPEIPQTLALFEYSNVSIPVAILIWLMIYPMMLKIDFTSIINATKNTKGLTVTCVTNWLVKPFSMYLISVLFFKVIFKNLIPLNLADEYIAGAVLLGAAPCTAMVFVWSQLTKGNPAYTLVQVAVNDLILLIGFVPIVALLLGINNVIVPYDTLILSVVLFVVIPLILGMISRQYIIKTKGINYFKEIFLKKFDKITITGLLLTLTIIFSFQGRKIIDNPVDILLISIPLTIQTFLIFFFAFGWAKIWKLPHEIASPAGMIGASNFFELAVAVAISLFGLNSGATLATVVGVLVEVPVMLILVNISNRTRGYFVKNCKEEKIIKI